MARRYVLTRPRIRECDWKPEEDRLLREWAHRGAGWIHSYRLYNRTVNAISTRRRVLEAGDGNRLPRLYRERRA